MKKAGADKGSTVKKRYRCDQNERRENVFRPSRYLGYDHDSLGTHLVSREAYDWATKALSLDPDNLENKHLIDLLERKLGIREPKPPWVHE